ncbi:MAG: hypothetical protein SOI57_02425 [Leuconostoc gelidum]|jgi:hypothetical protein|uniref:hypothetical protein n=2 Tax=Leuconostoc gelidum TaxID=1244 RepID=UPI001CC7D240|nr:hypothetical protein [Leuconostoc gelidum]
MASNFKTMTNISNNKSLAINQGYSGKTMKINKTLFKTRMVILVIILAVWLGNALHFISNQNFSYFAQILPFLLFGTMVYDTYINKQKIYFWISLAALILFTLICLQNIYRFYMLSH